MYVELGINLNDRAIHQQVITIKIEKNLANFLPTLARISSTNFPKI